MAGFTQFTWPTPDLSLWVLIFPIPDLVGSSWIWDSIVRENDVTLVRHTHRVFSLFSSSFDVILFLRSFSNLFCFIVWGCFSTCSLSRSDSGILEVNIASVILQVEPGELAFELTSENVGAKYCGLSTPLPFNKVLTSSQLLFNGYFLF